jgi:UPF0271 protein
VPTVDLNADLGEGGLYDDELLQVVSSCNVACGGHAGDAESMQATVAAAVANRVAVGAHPAYPDRGGFGRRSGFLHGDELRKSLIAQISALRDIATTMGVTLTHVKPHGALYNDAVNDRELATLIVSAVQSALPGAAFVGLPDSQLQYATGRSLRFVAEGFVDRAYQDNGQLLPRSEPGAVHTRLEHVLAQAIALVGKVDTLCIHGDTPGAAEIARAVRKELEKQGVSIRAIGR